MIKIYINIFLFFFVFLKLNIFSYDIISLHDNSKITGKITTISHDKITITIKYGKIDVINSDMKDIVLDEEIVIKEKINQKKYQEAINFYSNLIKTSTDISKKNIYSYKLALLYKNTKQYEKAIQILETLISSNEIVIFKIESYFHLVDIYILEKDFNNAELIISKLSELDNNLTNEVSARILFVKSLIENNKGNKENQARYLSEITKQHPKSIYKKRSERILKNINLEKKLKEALRKIPLEIEKIQVKRWRYSNVKLYDPLIEKCKYIIKKSTNIETLKETYLNLIQCYELQAEYGKAKTEMANYSSIFFKLYDKKELSSEGIIQKLEYFLNKRNFTISKEICKQMLKRKIYDTFYGYDEFYLIYLLSICYNNLNENKLFVSSSKKIMKYDFYSLSLLNQTYYIRACKKMINFYYQNNMFTQCLNIIKTSLQNIKDKVFINFALLKLTELYNNNEQFDDAKKVLSLIQKKYVNNK